MTSSIINEINGLKEKKLYRELRIFEGAPGRTVVIQEKEYINFSSNNYLGYANHPAVKKAAQDAVEEYGAGASASRLISGTLDIHHQLERKIAEFKGEESALVFPSGYQAGIGAITSLAGKDDAVIVDRLCHASLIDAVRLSGAKLLVYSHKDVEDLSHILQRRDTYQMMLVVTDGVFSMDGDIAPLKEITSLCERYNAYCLVDDAHGTGVLGQQGRGSIELCGIENRSIMTMGTLSKAIGSQGGFICGSKELIELLINKARSFIYTTGLNPAACGAALESMELIQKEPWKRKALLKKASYLRNELSLIGYNTLDSSAQIVPVMIGDVEDTLDAAKKLMGNHIYCPAIRPPTVPTGTARLRISLMSDHTDEDIDRLIAVMREYIQ